jgi:hypothetical protein
VRPDERLAALALGCLTRGLGWIERHIDLFVPDDPFDPEKLKELAELSILHGCLRAWHDACRSLELAPISKVLLEFLGDPRIAEWVRKLPAYYSPYMLAYLPLRATGTRIGGFEAALRVLTLRHYPEGLETTPYRELEFQHLCWKAGLTRRQPSCGAVYRRTTLARCPNPIYFSNPEVYSVTHTIFYLNDIAGPCRSMPASERERAIRVVEPLALHYWRKPDWDLTSELLLNLVALDHFGTPLFAAAFEAVAAAWQDGGALPGPAIGTLPSDPTRKQIFERCYHTTLVAMLLCGGYLWRSHERT